MIILAAATGVAVGLTGIPYYTFGVFLKPLAMEFGWTRSQVGLGSFFLHSGTFVLSPFLGSFVDRRGARPIALITLVGLAVGLLLLSQSGPQIATYYAAWVLVALLGCGTTPLTWTRMINQNFDKARGLALGMALAGTGIASVFGPRLSSWMIDEYGWRGAYIGLAALVFFIAFPVVFLTAPKKTAGPANIINSTGMTLRHAAATRAFWLIAVGIFVVIFGQASAMIHMVPLLTDRGLAPASAATLAGFMGVAVIVGRLGVGMLVDRFHAPHVAAAFIPLPAIAFLILLSSDSLATSVLAVLLVGLAAGAEVDLLAYFTSRYFGMRHYGKIYGVMLSTFALGAGLGPGATGWSHDLTGSYTAALWAGVVIFVSGAFILSRLGPYADLSRYRGQSAGESPTID
jgi:predicted MFS family arabinose efflux permease